MPKQNKISPNQPNQVISTIRFFDNLPKDILNVILAMVLHNQESEPNTLNLNRVQKNWLSIIRLMLESHWKTRVSQFFPHKFRELENELKSLENKPTTGSFWRKKFVELLKEITGFSVFQRNGYTAEKVAKIFDLAMNEDFDEFIKLAFGSSQDKLKKFEDFIKTLLHAFTLTDFEGAAVLSAWLQKRSKKFNGIYNIKLDHLPFAYDMESQTISLQLLKNKDIDNKKLASFNPRELYLFIKFSILFGRAEKFEQIVKSGLHLKLSARDFNNLVYHSCICGFKLGVDTFIELDKTCTFKSAIQSALIREYDDIVYLLSQKKPFMRSEILEMAYLRDQSDKTYKLMELLIKDEALSDKNCHTILQIAIESNNLKFLELCSKYKKEVFQELVFDVDTKRSYQFNFLGEAILLKSVQSETVEFLLKIRNDVNAPVDKSGYSPLALAILFSRDEYIDLFLKNGAVVHMAGRSPLGCAIVKNNREAVIKLLESNQEIDFELKCSPGLLENSAPRTLLSKAIAEANTSIFKILLDHIIKKNPDYLQNLNKLDTQEQNLLIEAIEAKKDKIVRVLIEEYNVDIRQCNSKKETPLHIAMKKINIKIINLLLDKCNDRDLEAQDEEGLTPLHVLVQSKDSTPFHSLLEQMVQRNPNILHIVNNKGLTPLLLALQIEENDAAEDLIKTDQCIIPTEYRLRKKQKKCIYSILKTATLYRDYKLIHCMIRAFGFDLLKGISTNNNNVAIVNYINTIHTNGITQNQDNLTYQKTVQDLQVARKKIQDLEEQQRLKEEDLQQREQNIQIEIQNLDEKKQNLLFLEDSINERKNRLDQKELAFAAQAEKLNKSNLDYEKRNRVLEINEKKVLHDRKKLEAKEKFLEQQKILLNNNIHELIEAKLIILRKNKSIIRQRYENIKKEKLTPDKELIRTILIGSLYEFEKHTEILIASLSKHSNLEELKLEELKNVFDRYNNSLKEIKNRAIQSLNADQMGLVSNFLFGFELKNIAVLQEKNSFRNSSEIENQPPIQLTKAPLELITRKFINRLDTLEGKSLQNSLKSIYLCEGKAQANLLRELLTKLQNSANTGKNINTVITEWENQKKTDGNRIFQHRNRFFSYKLDEKTTTEQMIIEIKSEFGQMSF